MDLSVEVVAISAEASLYDSFWIGSGTEPLVLVGNVAITIGVGVPEMAQVIVDDAVAIVVDLIIAGFDIGLRWCIAIFPIPIDAGLYSFVTSVVAGFLNPWNTLGSQTFSV